MVELGRHARLKLWWAEMLVRVRFPFAVLNQTTDSQYNRYFDLKQFELQYFFSPGDRNIEIMKFQHFIN